MKETDTTFVSFLQMKQSLCTSHALGCVPNNSWFPTALFPSKFGKGTAAPKILNYCKSGQNRSWQRERYPVGSLRKWPSLNVTRECTQEGAITKDQNVWETSDRDCSLYDTRHTVMFYKTNNLFTELHLQKCQLWRKIVQEHSLWGYFNLLFSKCCWLCITTNT